MQASSSTWRTGRVKNSGLNDGGSDWLAARETVVSNLMRKYLLRSGMGISLHRNSWLVRCIPKLQRTRGMNPHCSGDGTFLTEGTFEYRKIISITYQKVTGFPLNFTMTAGSWGSV